MTLLAVGLALADDPARAWETLYDARLVEAADGTPEVAALYYQELVSDLAPGDPLYGTAWYWLGRTRYGMGDMDAAVEALGRALGDPAVAPQAAALLSRIELREKAVRALPVSFGFEHDAGAFVRDWEDADKGRMEPRTLQGRTVLAWDTSVRSGEADRVAAALATEESVRAIAFSVRAREFPAEIRVTVSDGAGGRYSAPVIQVPTGEWRDVSLPASLFRSTDGARGGEGSALTSRDLVRLVEVEDLTGLLSPDRGQQTLYLDSFEVR